MLGSVCIHKWQNVFSKCFWRIIWTNASCACGISSGTLTKTAPCESLWLTSGRRCRYPDKFIYWSVQSVTFVESTELILLHFTAENHETVLWNHAWWALFWPSSLISPDVHHWAAHSESIIVNHWKKKLWNWLIFLSVKQSSIPLDRYQIEELIQRLDRDRTGMVDYRWAYCLITLTGGPFTSFHRVVLSVMR